MTQSKEPQSVGAAKPSPYELPPSARQGFMQDPRLKSPAVAAVLSLMPGLGQAYLGYTRLGFIHAGTTAFLIALLAPSRLGVLEPFFVVALVFLYFYNLVDAYRRALLLNEALLRMETPDLPDGLGALSFQARIGLGLGLILLGGGVFLRTRFGISFAWLADWWPVGVLSLGVYLVVRALMDRATEHETTPHS